MNSVHSVHFVHSVHGSTEARTTNGPGVRVEEVPCLACGSRRSRPLLVAEDDLTGKPGRFPFVVCAECGLAYQSPRVELGSIKLYYDDEYIAHRKKRSWGPLGFLVDRALDRLDRRKLELVARWVDLRRPGAALDVGCGAGTFLRKLQSLHGFHPVGVDFVDLSQLPGFDTLEFHCGLFYDVEVGRERFELITMWHFLEHDYDPARSLRRAREALKPDGRLVIEVPRLDSLSYRLYGDRWPGLQAPQHTVLFSKETLLRQLEKSGLEVLEYLPYGAYPAYFYLFAGAAFKVLKGRGLDLRRAVVPYFLGQVLLAPLLVFERRLNLAMQTVVCGRRA
ncbi:MAG: class I SAM-dependent methyltransferase [Deltaproteobacteria bacterium]|nr:class I SAM-dependent methyltransferase [Deltaproteobacteria bacterium]